MKLVPRLKSCDISITPVILCTQWSTEMQVFRLWLQPAVIWTASAKEESQKSFTQKIKDVSILPVRSHSRRPHCDRISVPGLRVMDHHGNPPGAVAASQLEADNTVGLMLLDFHGPFILFPWRKGSSGADGDVTVQRCGRSVRSGLLSW